MQRSAAATKTLSAAAFLGLDNVNHAIFSLVTFSRHRPGVTPKRTGFARENEGRMWRPGSERSLAAASRESGRAGLRSPRAAARVSGASSPRPGKVGGWSYARLAGQGARASGASWRRLGKGGGGSYARLAGQRVVERGGSRPGAGASARRPRSRRQAYLFPPFP